MDSTATAPPPLRAPARMTKYITELLLIYGEGVIDRQKYKQRELLIK